MAIFNPSPPKTQDPNYLGYSHPISQPQADQSLEALFKGIGNTLEAGLKTTDFLVKHKISGDIREQAEAERDAFTGQLEGMKSGFATRTAPVQEPASLEGQEQPYNMSAVEPSVFTAHAQALPDDLEDLPQALSTLHGARSSRVISQTDYMGRLAKMASEYRSQYPGYKDFIDKEFAQVTGVDPANAYVRSLISDINHAASARSGGTDPIMKEILAKNGIPGQPQMYEAYSRYLRGEPGGAPPGEVLKWINDWEVTDTKLKRMEAIRKAGEGNAAFQAENAGKEVQFATSSIANNYFNTINTSAGFTPAKIQDFIMSGAKIDQGTARQYAQHVNNARQTAFQEAWKRVTEGGQHAIINKLKGGAEEARKIINDNLVLFDNVSKSLMDEKVGHAYSAINTAKDLGDETKARLWGHPQLGEVLRMYDVIRQSGGDPLVGQMNTYVFGNTTVPETLKEELKQATGRMLTQTPPPNKKGAVSTEPVTVKQVLDAAQKAGIDDPGFNEKIYGVVEFIARPNVPDEVKQKAIIAAFHPSNAGIIERLEMDGTDPRTGRPTAGKYSIFKRMVNKDIIAEAQRLGMYDVVKNGAERMFGKELFQKEILDLNKFSLHPNMAISWNDKDKQWDMKIGKDPHALNKGLSPQYVDWPGIEFAQKSIRRLNSAIKNMKHIADAEGADLSVYIMDLMVASNWSPSEKIGNLPDHLARAIIESKMKAAAEEKAKEDTVKKYENK